MDIRLSSLLGLNNIKIILGSASPRRKELLSGLGFDFSIDSSSHTEETFPEGTPLFQIPESIAECKSMGFHRQLSDNEILITADTMVFAPTDEGDFIAMGKPQNLSEARYMLSILSGNTHKVITGVCLRDSSKKRTFSSTTDVTFKELSQEEIDYYVKNYYILDKAGAYAIQEWIGFIGITKIDGSYFNVMGLPTQLLYNELIMFANNNIVIQDNKNVI